MQYADKNLQPNVRNKDEMATDQFVDWYGQHLGIKPCLLSRPDKVKQGGIDGEYQLGDVLMLVEHTSLDELPDKQRTNKIFQIIFDAFEDVCLPEKDCVYSLSLPYDYPTQRNAEKIGAELRAWFESNAANYKPKKGTPRVQQAENCSHPLAISVWRSSRGRGRISLKQTASLEAQSRELAKTGLRQSILTCLERKLPKLLNHRATGRTIRVLILQNDEIWRGHKTDYAKFVRGYFHRNRDMICDEIWSLEIVGVELDCVLLWSKMLDKTTGKNPFEDDGLSLLQLINIRDWTWQVSRLSQVQNTPEYRKALMLLQKGLDAQGYLDEDDEQQLNALLLRLYKQNVTICP